MRYKTVKEAIDAAAKLPAHEHTQVDAVDNVSYVSEGDGRVVRVEHYCNATMSGAAKVTHKERCVRRAD